MQYQPQPQSPPPSFQQYQISIFSIYNENDPNYDLPTPSKRILSPFQKINSSSLVSSKQQLSPQIKSPQSKQTDQIQLVYLQDGVQRDCSPVPPESNSRPNPFLKQTGSGTEILQMERIALKEEENKNNELKMNQQTNTSFKEETDSKQNEFKVKETKQESALKQIENEFKMNTQTNFQTSLNEEYDLKEIINNKDHLKQQNQMNKNLNEKENVQMYPQTNLKYYTNLNQEKTKEDNVKEIANPQTKIQETSQKQETFVLKPQNINNKDNQKIKVNDVLLNEIKRIEIEPEQKETVNNKLNEQKGGYPQMNKEVIYLKQSQTIPYETQQLIQKTSGQDIVPTKLTTNKDFEIKTSPFIPKTVIQQINTNNSSLTRATAVQQEITKDQESYPNKMQYSGEEQNIQDSYQNINLEKTPPTDSNTQNSQDPKYIEDAPDIIKEKYIQTEKQIIQPKTAHLQRSQPEIDQQPDPFDVVNLFLTQKLVQQELEKSMHNSKQIHDDMTQTTNVEETQAESIQDKNQTPTQKQKEAPKSPKFTDPIASFANSTIDPLEKPQKPKSPQLSLTPVQVQEYQQLLYSTPKSAQKSNISKSKQTPNKFEQYKFTLSTTHQQKLNSIFSQPKPKYLTTDQILENLFTTPQHQTITTQTTSKPVSRSNSSSTSPNRLAQIKKDNLITENALLASENKILNKVLHQTANKNKKEHKNLQNYFQAQIIEKETENEKMFQKNSLIEEKILFLDAFLSEMKETLKGML
ncbi:Hypothetical_protein [Hexamita inflata]|uniref:Hypothetical_protein n=1 Tax=Hexamita inflata TaxID=28002 RepID=A0AA86ULD8_9EUKA|nr:Hypothetical protein HINF_LOCUS31608 [Hexamita inflata]